jgi:hypothetical protein
MWRVLAAVWLLTGCDVVLGLDERDGDAGARAVNARRLDGRPSR